MEVPEFLLRPPLIDGASDILDGFWELSTERNFFPIPNGGVVIGPIPHSAISAWINRFEDRPTEDADLVLKCIRALDQVFVSFHNKTGKKGKGKTAVSETPMNPGLFDSLF